MKQDDVLNKLSNQDLKFVFENAKGEETVMNGTRDSAIIAIAIEQGHIKPTVVKEGTEPKPQDFSKSVPVYSTDRKGWRSIRWDRLKTVDGIEFVHEAVEDE